MNDNEGSERTIAQIEGDEVHLKHVNQDVRSQQTMKAIYKHRRTYKKTICKWKHTHTYTHTHTLIKTIKAASRTNNKT